MAQSTTPPQTSRPIFASSAAKALNEMDDRRIGNIRPLLPPAILMEEFPLTLEAATTVMRGRAGAEAILKGQDDRLLCIVGPCSVHDCRAALEYSTLLKAYADEAQEDLHIIMRVYFEKPRTTVGWKGLLNDPQLDGSFRINEGLRLGRGLLLEIAKRGLPAGVEFLDTISPQYIADTVSWGAIGARTTESQCHRELASGLSTPVGFKNGTDGSISIAVDAIRAASSGHVFLSVTKQGLSAIVETNGNDACHVILRGSNTGPNYSETHVVDCRKKLESAGLPAKILIDASHGNSQKQHDRQLLVVEDIARQLEETSTGNAIMGVMIESNLVAGRQNIPKEGPQGLVYGQSVTDACIDWSQTVTALNRLRKAVQTRRTCQQNANSGGQTLNDVNALATDSNASKAFNSLVDIL